MGIHLTAVLFCDTPGCSNSTELCRSEGHSPELTRVRDNLTAERSRAAGWTTLRMNWGTADLCPDCAKTTATPAPAPGADRDS